jgi:hypothetical protein
MDPRRWMLLALLLGALCGCDGKDPERLNRVGKKMVDKSRRVADEAELPRVTVTMPERSGSEEPEKPKAENSVPARN